MANDDDIFDDDVCYYCYYYVLLLRGNDRGSSNLRALRHVIFEVGVTSATLIVVAIIWAFDRYLLNLA